MEVNKYSCAARDWRRSVNFLFCGHIRATLQQLGQPIGNNDLWLAAHALAEGWTLVTNNTREFARVPGLQVENWVE